MSDEKIVGIGGKKPASPKKKGKQRIPNNHPVLAFFARLEEKVDRHEILSVRSTNFSSEFCDPLEVLNEEEDQVEIDEQEFALLVQIELGGIFQLD